MRSLSAGGPILLTPPARLHAALELIAEVETSGRPADAVISAGFRSRRDLHDEDRGRISDLVYAVLRTWARTGWRLDQLEAPPTPRTRLLVWLALGEGVPRARISAQFSGGRSAPARLSPAELSLLGRLDGGTLDHPRMPEAVRAECPDWALAPLQARFGDAFGAEMAAMLAPPPLDLRVSPLKTSRDVVLGDLRRLGFSAQPCPRAPFGVRLPERVSLAALPMLRTGAAEVQDEGSQLVAGLVDARPGERVVDFCAGAGGKSLALATQMENRGLLVACDVSEGRLKRAAERFRRAGLHNIQTRVLAGERDRWVKRHKGGFDRVLVDAPCSGTGTWRRNPDARWRPQAEGGLAVLAALQAAILDSAARLVRPGGRLVYATCSLLPQENEAQARAFLATHPDFRLVPLAEAAPGITESEQPDMLSLTPARHGTDGFFAAVMTRTPA